MTSRRPDVLRGSLRTLVVIGAGVVALLLLNLALARLLDAEGFGAWGFAFAWAEVLALLAPLGLDRLLTREVAVGVQREAWGQVRALVRTSNAVTSGAAVLAAAAIGLVMVVLRPVLDDALFPAIWVALLIVPLRALIHLRHGVLLGLDRPAAGMAPTTTIFPAALLAGVAALWVIDRDALTAAWVAGLAVAATAVALGWSELVARRAGPPPLAGAAAGDGALRPWLAASVPMMLITALAIVNLRTDVIMLGGLRDAAAAGVYAIAAQVAFAVRFGLLAASPAISGPAASLHAAGGRAELRRALRTAARIILAVAVAALAFLAAFGRPVLGLFGGEFEAGYDAMLILAAGGTLMMAFGPGETVLMMTGHERIAALSGGIAALANLVLNATLIPLFGIAGAAFATAASGVVWAGILNRVAARRVVDPGPW